MKPRRGAIGSAGALLAIVVLVGACSGSAATGSPGPTASGATSGDPSAAPSKPTPDPAATPTIADASKPAPATPAPRPNLVSGAPVLTPAGPTCAVSFNIDALITNTGAGPTLSPARVAIVAIRSSDGWIGLKEFQDIPALPAGTHTHVNKDVTITRAGSFELQIIADSNLWFAETHEDDNTATKKITVGYGTCGKA
jgi:hypothetical protein